jgi:hypothetical protein
MMMLSSSLRRGFFRRIGAVKKLSIVIVKPEHIGRPIHHHYNTPGITPGLGYLPSLSPFVKQSSERIGIPFWLTIAAGTGLCIWPNTDASKNNNKTSCAPTHNNNQKKKAGEQKKKTGRVLRMAGSKGGRLRKGEEVVLDLEDPSDRAYHLVSCLRFFYDFFTYRTDPKSVSVSPSTSPLSSSQLSLLFPTPGV